MKRRAHFVLFIFSLVLCRGASGQVTAQPPVQLANVEFAHSAALEGRGIGLTQIGSDGFFYAQVIVGFSFTTAIKRISFDGADATSYDVGRILKPMYLSGRSPFIESFCVGNDGRVDILTDWYEDQLPGILTIVVFDPDGSVSDIIPVHLKNSPHIMHFAQFGNGRYLLIAGYSGSGFFDRVDAVLMSDSGEVLRQESLRKLSGAEEKEVGRARQRDFEQREAQQESPQGAGPRHGSSLASGDENKSGKNAANRPDNEMGALFSETVLIRGDDGNIYMARPDHSGTLYRVSESGDITPVPLSMGQKPAPMNSHTQLMGGSIHDGELMLCYGSFDLPADSPKPRTMQRLTIKTYSLEGRQLLATYTGVRSQIASPVVGWDGNTFYFLHYANNGQRAGYEIEKATP